MDSDEATALNKRYMSTGKSISVELCMFPYFKKYSHKKIAEMMTFMENGK
jgi:hypothetical protein